MKNISIFGKNSAIAYTHNNTNKIITNIMSHYQ